MKDLFDYTVPSWQELGEYCFFGGLLGTVLAIILLFIVMWI